MTSHPILRVNPVETWRSTMALWTEMALAPSRVAQAQARAGLRLMEAASPWRLRVSAGTLRNLPDGGVRTMAAVVTLPRVAEFAPAPASAPDIVDIGAEPEVAEVVVADTVAPEPVEAADAAPEAEHLPHGALAEASPLAVTAGTAEEALPVEAPAAEEPVAPAPLAVLAEPAAETLESAALEPMLALSEGADRKKSQAKGGAGSTPRKPRARRG